MPQKSQQESAVFLNKVIVTEKNHSQSDVCEKEKHVLLRISEVVPNRNQPRTVFQEKSLEELSKSIRQFGVLQPIIVQKKGRFYEIIAGERRWRAAKKAGLKKIPVIIHNFSEKESAEIALIENIQRENLNPIEEAKAYKRLLDEFHMKQDEIADRVSRSRSAIANSMRLLHLDSRVQDMIAAGAISSGHARALLGLSDLNEQYASAQKILSDHLSVRDTEKLVKKSRKIEQDSHTKKSKDFQMEAVYRDLESGLTEKTGTKVRIRRSGRNKGKIEIEYYSNDDLERIIRMIGRGE